MSPRRCRAPATLAVVIGSCVCAYPAARRPAPARRSYKPQVARSGAGFITGLLLPKGNAADSEQLIPMVDEVVRRTAVVPEVLSLDDGYASRANMQEMQDRGIQAISIHGAKGRALTAHARLEQPSPLTRSDPPLLAKMVRAWIRIGYVDQPRRVGSPRAGRRSAHGARAYEAYS